jgi:hypothetical protein
MSWQIKEMKIQNIYLDQFNIRIPITYSSQNALIQDLFSNEDAFDLVKSISQYGIFPDEFPIVIEEEKKKIVIEGNRRIAALKAMSEPDIVPSFKNKLMDYQKNKIETIRVVIAPDRASAMTLIANKHTINLRRAWKPLRQAYFYKSQIENGKSIETLMSEYPEHDIIKFIRMLDMHKLAKAIDYGDEEVSSNVHDERKFPISNLERMYSDPKVRSFLGISFSEKGQVKGSIPFEEFSKGYSRIVEDVSSGEIDSRKYNSDKQREEYLKKIPKSQTPNKQIKGSFSAANTKEKSVPKIEKGKKEIGHKTPKGLFQSASVPFKINSSPLKIMYDELRKINVADFSNATHDLLRSFLECSIITFLKAVGHYEKVQKNDNHNPKLSEMLTYLMSPRTHIIVDPNLLQAIDQIKQQYTENYSLERMNMINHNENWVSTEKDVRAAWARLEALFIFLLGDHT